MLASTCSIRLPTLATVKFLSRLFTALNWLPSIATMARVKRFNRRSGLPYDLPADIVRQGMQCVGRQGADETVAHSIRCPGPTVDLAFRVQHHRPVLINGHGPSQHDEASALVVVVH